MARDSTNGSFPTSYHAHADDNEAIKPELFKFGGEAVFEHLVTPHVPHDLDYCEVVYSLMAVLTSIYSKLLDHTCASEVMYEALIRLDQRIKHHVVGLLGKDNTSLAIEVFREQVEAVGRLFASPEALVEMFEREEGKDGEGRRGVDCGGGGGEGNRV